MFSNILSQAMSRDTQESVDVPLHMQSGILSRHKDFLTSSSWLTTKRGKLGPGKLVLLSHPDQGLAASWQQLGLVLPLHLLQQLLAGCETPAHNIQSNYSQFPQPNSTPTNKWITLKPGEIVRGRHKQVGLDQM